MYHVLPINDIKSHQEESSCICSPTVEIVESGDMLIIHNSFDGRENKENKNGKGINSSSERRGCTKSDY